MEFRTNGNKATIGITVLGAISAFSVWSACNPSLFTVAQFTTEQSKKNARFGMKVGVALNALLGAGIYLAYGKKGLFPAVLTTATGVGLYFLYEHMLNKVNISNPSGQDMNQQHLGFKGQSKQDIINELNMGGGSILGAPSHGSFSPGTPNALSMPSHNSSRYLPGNHTPEGSERTQFERNPLEEY